MSCFQSVNWQATCYMHSGHCFMRRWLIGIVLLCALAPLRAATLQMLSMDDMIQLSTLIVHGRVTGVASWFKGPIIYTHYQIQVIDQYKGTATQQVDVAVPGGVANGYQQTFAGAPVLNPGDEYVFFLWTSKSGLTQILGLTQGLFSVTTDGNGQLTLSRSASSEPMLSRKTGQPVQDQAMRLSVQSLKSKIAGSAPR